MMRRAFKKRLYPNHNQTIDLTKTGETHRRLYNATVTIKSEAGEAIKAAKEAGLEPMKSPNYGELCRRFTQARKTNNYYDELYAQSAQATIKRVFRAFENFFRRLKEGGPPGYPNLKPKGSDASFTFPQADKGVRLEGNRLRIHNIGSVKIKLHRQILGTVKTVTIKQEGEKWYAVFSCELPDVPIVVTDKPAVGIDVGLESFLATSDGDREPNPRYLMASLPALKRAQRAVSRKTRMNGKRGKRRRKAVKKVAKIHAKIASQRKDHARKVACQLVRRYGKIAAECLNIHGMLRSRWFSRSIADAGWGDFLWALRCKAEATGVAYVEVDPRGTSQECSECGRTGDVRKDLSVRLHECEHCGYCAHRDHNAARNILRRGVAAWTGPPGYAVTAPG